MTTGSSGCYLVSLEKVFIFILVKITDICVTGALLRENRSIGYNIVYRWLPNYLDYHLSS